MNSRLARFLSPIAVMTAFMSCTQGGGSIYYNLEHEQKQQASNLGNTINVSDLVYLDTNSTYYAAAGRIFYSTPDPNGVPTWNNADFIPKSGSLAEAGALCNALAAFQGDLYGGFGAPHAVLGLYRAAGDDFSGASQITDPSVSGQQVTRLTVANSGNTLLIITTSADTTTYCLTAFDGSTFTPVLDTSSNITSQIWDAAYDGTLYYAVSGNTLYSGVPGSMSTTTTLGDEIASTDVLKGVYAAGPNDIYIVSKSSGIYHTTDGATWTHIAADVQNGKNVSYLSIAGTTIGKSGNPLMLFGSEGYGIYFFDGATLTRSGSGSDDAQLRTLTLYSGVVLRLVLFPSASPQLAFACTAGAGLWQGGYNSSDPSGISGWAIK